MSSSPSPAANADAAPCPCGSGAPYAQCCGDERTQRTREQAFRALAEVRLADAERLFRAALAENRDDLGSLHLLGVTLRRRLRYRESLAALLEVAERTGWQVARVRDDLATTIGALVGEPERTEAASPARLRKLARRLLDSDAGAALAPNLRGTAVVVLGMHRSGTSALTRVLALCGAALPGGLMPAHEQQNPRGFWESLEVVALDDSLLDRLGGDWRRPPPDLPPDAETQANFERAVGLLLRTQFADNDSIVLKDPRMPLVAASWDAALRANGWRPAFIVPVRDPLEVAHSLAARDGLDRDEALALWCEYMRRIERFAHARDDVLFVRSGALLADWRDTIRRIADRFDLRLDLDAAAPAVAAFLDPKLHRQRADEREWQALRGVAPVEDARARRDALLARCASDARLPVPVVTESFAIDPAATATFVLCIEANAICAQALLLAESIRRWGGRHRDAPILAYAPRPGLGVDAATRARLAALRVEYIDLPLNTACPEYGSANRVFAAAHAERHAQSDFLIVLDSDTVFLDEPALPAAFDALVRPVDAKGSASAGPGDPFDPYWQSLAALAGMPLDRLPFVHATATGECVRASYNGGLVVVRRALGLMRRWAALFEQSARAGQRPYRDSGHDVFASTGHVGRAASEWWGSNQAALALTLWQGAARVGEYSPAYNLPLHFVANDDGIVATRWRAARPVHVHYHWLFARGRHEEALALLEQLGVARDRREWLARRLPLD